MLPYSVPDGATGEPHQKPTLRANHTYLDLGLVFEIQRYTRRQCHSDIQTAQLTVS